MTLNLTNLSKLASSGGMLVVASSEEFVTLNYVIAATITHQLGANCRKEMVFAERNFDFAAIKQQLGAGSLFGEGNFYHVQFKGKLTPAQIEQISELTPLIEDGSFVLITTDKLDKKDLSQTFYANLAQAQRFLSVQGSLAETEEFATYVFQQLGLSVTRDAISFLIGYNQNNWLQLYQEIQRLSYLVTDGAEISIELLQSVLADNSRYNVFALSAAYLVGDKLKSQTIFHNLFQVSEDAILIIWCLQEDLRKLILLKGKLRHNSNLKNAFNELRIWGESAKHFTQANTRISYNLVLKLFDLVAQLDLLAKGLKKGNLKQQLEQVIINFCSGEG
jgi:DNA polymerase-3 subunit delta